MKDIAFQLLLICMHHLNMMGRFPGSVWQAVILQCDPRARWHCRIVRISPFPFNHQLILNIKVKNNDRHGACPGPQVNKTILHSL